MPKIRGARICPTQGCPNDMPCTEHTRTPWATSNRRERLPNGWAKLRARILRRDRYRCQTQGCRARATEVDHVINNDDHDPTNLQSLCSPCHLKKTLAEAQAGRRNQTA